MAQTAEHGHGSVFGGRADNERWDGVQSFPNHETCTERRKRSNQVVCRVRSGLAVQGTIAAQRPRCIGKCGAVLRRPSNMA